MLEDRFTARSSSTAHILFRRADGWVMAHLAEKPEVEVKSRTFEGAVLELLLVKYGLTFFELNVPPPLGSDIPGLREIAAREMAETTARVLEHEGILAGIAG